MLEILRSDIKSPNSDHLRGLALRNVEGDIFADLEHLQHEIEVLRDMTQHIFEFEWVPEHDEFGYHWPMDLKASLKDPGPKAARVSSFANSYVARKKASILTDLPPEVQELDIACHRLVEARRAGFGK